MDGLDGNGLLSKEDKMAAGAFGRGRNYGCAGPFEVTRAHAAVIQCQLKQVL